MVSSHFSQGDNKRTRPLETTVKYSHAVHVYPDGIRLIAPARGGKNEQSGKHLRGEIKGWSKSSRRRMRDFMMTRRLPDEEYFLAAVTLTIPGYPLKPSESRLLGEKWRTYVKNKQWPTVWRVEVQKRGQLHWHCIVGIKRSESTLPEAIDLIKDSWHTCMDLMGEIEYTMVGKVTDPTEVGFVTGRQRLMEWKGAKKYSCHVDLMDNQEAGWKRYLFDHTTKVKQEQVAENIGRHWGVIVRKAFVEVLPSKVSTMTRKEYARFTRCLNRMFTPYIKHDGALFGRKRGFTVKRGKMGKTDIFTKSNPTIDRLINWSISY